MNDRTRSKWLTRAAALLAVVTFYGAFSSFAFAWRHPHMTQMQVFQHLGDAMLWREVE